MPTPKTSSVPQLMRLTTLFQSITPMLGSIRSAMAHTVVVVVSKGWSFFSVTHIKRSTRETTVSFHSAADMGPSFASSRRTASSPPEIFSSEPLKSRVTTT